MNNSTHNSTHNSTGSPCRLALAVFLALAPAVAPAQTLITSSTAVTGATYTNTADSKLPPLTINAGATFTGSNITITADNGSAWPGRMALRLNAGASATIRGGAITHTRTGVARGLSSLVYLYGNARLDASDITITTNASEPNLRPLGVAGSRPNRLVLNRATITSGGNVTALILAGPGAATLTSSTLSTNGAAAPGAQIRGHRAGFTLSLDGSVVRAGGANSSGIYIAGQDFGAGGSSRVVVSLKNTAVTSGKGAGIDINTPIPGLSDVDTRTKVPDGWKGNYEITLENSAVTGAQAALRVTTDPVAGSADRELPTTVRVTLRSSGTLAGGVALAGSASLAIAIDKTSAVTGPIVAAHESVLALDTEKFPGLIALSGSARLRVSAPLTLTGTLATTRNASTAIVLDLARGARLVLDGAFALDGTHNLAPENLPAAASGAPSEIQLVEDKTGKLRADAFNLADGATTTIGGAAYALETRAGGVWLVPAAAAGAGAPAAAKTW